MIFCPHQKGRIKFFPTQLHPIFKLFPTFYGGFGLKINIFDGEFWGKCEFVAKSGFSQISYFEAFLYSFRAKLPHFCTFSWIENSPKNPCVSLKIPRDKTRIGSSPISGTTKGKIYECYPFLLPFCDFQRIKFTFFLLV